MIVNTTYTARGDVDPRVAELTELAASEGYHGVRLSLSAVIEMVLYYEDMGMVVDLHTGIALCAEMVLQIAEVTPSGVAVNHLLTPATADEVDHMLDTLICKHPDVDECAPDGTLQALADAADRVQAWYDAELQEQVDGRLDDDYHASGNW